MKALSLLEFIILYTPPHAACQELSAQKKGNISGALKIFAVKFLREFDSP